MGQAHSHDEDQGQLRHFYQTFLAPAEVMQHEHWGAAQDDRDASIMERVHRHSKKFEYEMSALQ